MLDHNIIFIQRIGKSWHLRTHREEDFLRWTKEISKAIFETSPLLRERAMSGVEQGSPPRAGSEAPSAPAKGASESSPSKSEPASPDGPPAPLATAAAPAPPAGASASTSTNAPAPRSGSGSASTAPGSGSDSASAPALIASPSASASALPSFAKAAGNPQALILASVGSAEASFAGLALLPPQGDSWPAGVLVMQDRATGSIVLAARIASSADWVKSIVMGQVATPFAELGGRTLANGDVLRRRDSIRDILKAVVDGGHVPIFLTGATTFASTASLGAVFTAVLAALCALLALEMRTDIEKWWWWHFIFFFLFFL